MDALVKVIINNHDVIMFFIDYFQKIFIFITGFDNHFDESTKDETRRKWKEAKKRKYTGGQRL